MTDIVKLNGRATLGARVLFETISLDIPKGHWIALLGPSGIGKSSLIRAMAGLPTALEFSGQFAVPAHDQISWMAQDDLLLPWKSVLSNVVLGDLLRGIKPNTDKAYSLLSQVGLADLANRRPDTLSGGERQRAALARTLMEDRPVVFLDEPFSALDAKTRTEVQNLARRVLAGKTVVMVTHDPLEAVRLSDKAYLLSQTGLTLLHLPHTQPPRAPEAAETLSAQGAIYQVLMAT